MLERARLKIAVDVAKIKYRWEGGSVSMEEQKDDKIKIHIEPDSFKISGKVPIGKKEIYILLAILAAAVGVSYEEIFSYMGVM